MYVLTPCNVTDLPANLVLFDGVCNLCDALVQFVIRHDRAGKIRFAAIQSEAGRKIFESQGLDPANLQTFVFTANGRVFLRSDAAIEVLTRFGGPWRVLRIFLLVPRPVRDFLYSVVARNRYRWFGRKDACMIPAADVKDRFID